MRRSFACCVILASALACERVEAPPPHRAFYHWRTALDLTAAERRALADLRVDRLYLRYFDVAWEAGAPRQVSPLSAITSPPAGIEVVPVVFVRDAVFREATAEQRARLAADVWADVVARSARMGVTVRELQLDCDWTETTRDAYFDFLRHFPREVALSATIRLHQVKYRERTGVPPVSRGMLMFYNMGTIGSGDGMSIFDPAAARSYLARVPDYPLPLDAALPIWSWAIHLRDDHVEGLFQSLDPTELAEAPWLAREAPDRYRATETTFLRGSLVRAGDVIRTETVDAPTVLAAAELLAPALPAGPRTITLFDLSPRSLARHDTPSLDHLFRTLR